MRGAQLRATMLALVLGLGCGAAHALGPNAHATVRVDSLGRVVVLADRLVDGRADGLVDLAYVYQDETPIAWFPPIEGPCYLSAIEGTEISSGGETDGSFEVTLNFTSGQNAVLSVGEVGEPAARNSDTRVFRGGVGILTRLLNVPVESVKTEDWLFLSESDRGSGCDKGGEGKPGCSIGCGGTSPFFSTDNSCGVHCRKGAYACCNCGSCTCKKNPVKKPAPQAPASIQLESGTGGEGWE